MDKLLKVIAEQNEEAECCFQLKRIADAMETIIKMVKEDQERSRKYMEEPKPDLPENVPFKGRL
jgi:hypothetical protein